MPADLVSLAFVALVAACSPLVAKLVPNKLIPEAVFLLIAGALLGPHMLGFVEVSDSVALLSDLGLGFLFLLAGYEINPKSLTGSQGKRGLLTWAVSLALAFAITYFAGGLLGSELEAMAITIALTTTALGTLMPILKERELVGTRIGESILAYGTWGELCPVLAMTLLLSARAEWKTMLILVAFVAVAVVAAVVPSKAKKAGHRVFRFLSENAESTSQTMMRMTVLLLVGLIALSAVFDLDIVLGAFAAGFVLRYIIPEGDGSLEKKLDGVAYGFLIPVFFIVSGAKIDLMAVFEQPGILVGFIVLLLLVRAVPIFVALATGKDTRDLSAHNRLTIALYCTTALPIIVAVTSVAVSADAMSQDMASVLVAAGAITVFLMPLLATLTYRVADADPLEAVREIRRNPHDFGEILRDHWALERILAHQESIERRALRHREQAAAMLSRRLPSDAHSAEVLLPSDAMQHAAAVMSAPEFDDAAWQQAKLEGDKSWSKVKAEGDARWTRMKAEGDVRWDELKRAGDEMSGMPWQDRAAALQEKTDQRRALDEALDATAQDLAAKTPDAVEGAVREMAAKGVDIAGKLDEAAKRALEAAHAAGRLPAAADQAAEETASLSKAARRVRLREERHKRAVARAAKEQQRRLVELTRAAGRMGVSDRDASWIFEDGKHDPTDAGVSKESDDGRF